MLKIYQKNMSLSVLQLRFSSKLSLFLSLFYTAGGEDSCVGSISLIIVGKIPSLFNFYSLFLAESGHDPHGLRMYHMAIPKPIPETWFD